MKKTFLATITSLYFLVQAVVASAAGPKISDMGTGGDNKHNLSSKNLRTSGYKADPSDPRGSQICIFCHTPHNAGQIPLWNRGDPAVSFGHYSSPTLVIRHTPAASYNEPTGSSRLCLSCHDGVTAGGIPLGQLLVGAPAWDPIKMLYADRIAAGSPALFTAAKIKTGHHPVSFVYDPTVLQAIKDDPLKSGQNYSLPSLKEVKLDQQYRMQCTTCHDPHQNKSRDDQFYPPDYTRKIAPFWVYGANDNASLDHDAVCKDCHQFTTPSPWQ